ncbi:RNA polymerase sigma factor [Variovorax sp.]|jgi:RNA polymerase sigma factor (sigma-70 family)|uniref:RNA polymerase sigma factor n=1 Tax=Variovorax sp. TaxID=1871043 RepID=UPI0037DA6C63
MADDARPVLLDYLNRHYASLKLRVTRLLGNGDLAGDALQDTWLRVQSKDEEDPIHSPGSYLVRMAVNIAVDIQRRQARSLSLDEVGALLELPDPAPGPAQVAEARSDLQALRHWMERLPARRREVVVLVHMEGLEHKEVARRLGISVRTVAYELQHAHDYLNARMNDDGKK